jgi:MFS family permease
MSRSPRSNIRRLALGRLISVTGGAAAYTALNFTVWERTHSPKMQALSLLLTFGVAGILGPLGGALGDRFDRRKVMIISEAASALVFVAMVPIHDPGLLIGVAFVSALTELPFFSASRAAIPNLAEREEDIAWANSLVTTGVHAGIAVGPVIGGLLVGTVGPAWVFGLNAASFLVSLVITVQLRGRFHEERTAAHDEHQGIGAGVRFLWREPVLRRMSAAWLVFVLGMGMGMVADAPLAESFHAGGLGFGLLIACWGTGSVIGTLFGRWLNERTEPVVMVLGAAGIALAAAGVGFAPVFPLVLGSLLIMGTCDGLTIVAENGVMQRRTPDAVRSRTMAAFDAALSLGLVVAYLCAGPALRALGPQPVYRIGAVGAAGATLVLLPLIRLRHAPATAGAEEEPQVETTLAVEGALLPPAV